MARVEPFASGRRAEAGETSDTYNLESRSARIISAESEKVRPGLGLDEIVAKLASATSDTPEIYAPGH